jgi:hypothetical protein
MKLDGLFKQKVGYRACRPDRVGKTSRDVGAGNKYSVVQSENPI